MCVDRDVAGHDGPPAGRGPGEDDAAGRWHAKPGSLLKSQIPIRTSAQWVNAAPGFVEIDLVGHEGGNALGGRCYTLTVTHIATGWTENRSVPNNAHRWVIAALAEIATIMPFPIIGVDSDNGSADQPPPARLVRPTPDHLRPFASGQQQRRRARGAEELVPATLGGIGRLQATRTWVGRATRRCPRREATLPTDHRRLAQPDPAHDLAGTHRVSGQQGYLARYAKPTRHRRRPRPRHQLVATARRQFDAHSQRHTFMISGVKLLT